ncbi:MAG: type I DNA topoisomerase, partial [Anaerolineaceae bacterium]|nr:type I DNA topoisomerase [Anaerolineaceae bacterium]
KGRQSYLARLTRVDDAEPRLEGESNARLLLEDLETAQYTIHKIQRGERRRKPAAPFITSTLQQEASRRLGYTTKRTMALAQQLYEGVDVGEGGSTGLITYMRTDSTNISEQALSEVRQYILKTYGGDFLPAQAPQHKTRAKNAQEAHEAIRPTSTLRLPSTVKEFLSRDQFRLYQLIWQRFVASQMEAAVLDTLAVDILGETGEHRYNFRASGSTLRFPGFLIVYEEAQDEDKKSEEADEVRIPPALEEGQRQELIRLIPEQHFTQPPPRFTEASLVQTLEEYGIGRPSTYAPILSTIQDRGYVYREGKRLFPTETGILVNDLLVAHFSNIVDTRFTASMELDLDNISTGESRWADVVSKFYDQFGPQLKRAQEEMPIQKAELEKIGRACPDCGKDLVIRWGRYGKFISCSAFPECRYTEPWLEKIGVSCPQCGKDLISRKTRKGRIFYGCLGYPECQFTSWKLPTATPCPRCGGMLVLLNKRELKCLGCAETFLTDQLEEFSAETA